MKDSQENIKITQMLDFINFNSSTEDKDRFLVFAKKYVDFVYQDEKALKKYNSFSELVFDSAKNAEFVKNFKLLQDLQKHLKTFINSIIAPQKTSKEIKLKGVKTVKFENQEMIEVFKSEKIQNIKMTLASEKKVLESTLVGILTDSDAVLKRFKKCQSQECSNFFYDRKKLYCSTRCGNFQRQREYKKKQNKN